MKSILLAPHADDETLFCAYTIMRYKPLVIIVTDSMKGTDFMLRRKETLEAMKILGADVIFLGLRDDTLDELDLEMAIEGLRPEAVYAPAQYPNGHKAHNIVGSVAKRLWKDRLFKYATYEYPNENVLTGDIIINPSKVEIELKDKALLAYTSQINSQAIVHFKTVRNKPEYYIK
jgi:LmbE family N-acetylglucosaminyl deacetylase